MKSKVPSTTGAQGKRKIEFEYKSDNDKLELKEEWICEGVDNIVEYDINEKDGRYASEPLTIKKGEILIKKIMIMVCGK